MSQVVALDGCNQVFKSRLDRPTCGDVELLVSDAFPLSVLSIILRLPEDSHCAISWEESFAFRSRWDVSHHKTELG